MKKFQAILKEILEISRIPMILYDADGVCAAATANVDETLTSSVRDFIASDADNQSIGTFHYFKVVCLDTLSFVLVVINYTADSFTIGRLTVCQLRHLLESQEESVTKSGFIKNLIYNSLTPTEAARQIKKLKLSAVTWAAFMIECNEEFEDSSAYQMLEHAFAENKMDLCCRLDENHLLLFKDTTDIIKDFKPHMVRSKKTQKKKEKEPEDSILLSSSLELFAQTLVDTLRSEILIQTHVGYSTTADSFADLQRLYQEAATALRIRRTFFAERDTIAYNRLGIGRLISELPVSLCSAFLSEIFGAHIPTDLDEETQNTIQKFYENNLNISETARQLYLHRNTLVYRLERLEKMLGLDIRKFEDAMTFKLAMMVLAHVQEAGHL